MPYAPAVVERTMKVQEVLLQAMSGKLTWWQAEEILGWSPRTLRRWRLRYQRQGYDGLWDRRGRRPPPRPGAPAVLRRDAAPRGQPPCLAPPLPHRAPDAGPRHR